MLISNLLVIDTSVGYVSGPRPIGFCGTHSRRSPLPAAAALLDVSHKIERKIGDGCGIDRQIHAFTTFILLL
jgi:hypothetical protein